MKSHAFFLFWLSLQFIWPPKTFAQSASSNTIQSIFLSFEEAEKQGLSDKMLSKSYPSRTKIRLENRKARKALDQRQGEQWLAFWEAFDEGLSSRPQNLSIYHKFYFDPEGRIVYFLYNIQPENTDERIVNHFLAGLEQYVSSYSFDLGIGQNWSQCGSWTYEAKKN